MTKKKGYTIDQEGLLDNFPLEPTMYVEDPIAGQTALITGASRGIGRAIALAFANAGVKRLLLMARNRDRLEEVVQSVRNINPKVEVVALPVDLTKMEEMSATVAKAWREYGPIHILVNNAGVAHQTPFLSSRSHQAQSELNVNLMGMYDITRLVARRMVARKEGTIINVSSLMGKVAAPTYATYSATKFAIVGFTQALRAELSPYNIRVVSLLPSLTDTDMVKNTQWFKFITPSTPEKVAQALVKGLATDSNEIFVDWQSKLAALGSRIFPSLVEKVVSLSAPNTPQTLPENPIPLGVGVN